MAVPRVISASIVDSSYTRRVTWPSVAFIGAVVRPAKYRVKSLRPEGLYARGGTAHIDSLKVHRLDSTYRLVDRVKPLVATPTGGEFRSSRRSVR
ncbi:hypothetical protein ACFQ0Q_48470 [Streptomyces aureus]